VPVPGHWEGDLLLGTRDTAIATLVERQTRYCQLVALPDGTNAEPVCEALGASITTLPEQLRRSLTWTRARRWPSTNGSPLRPECRSTSAIPAARGSEGRMRTPTGCSSVLPERQDLAGITQAELDEVARKLNDRPRQTLGFRTPRSETQ